MFVRGKEFVNFDTFKGSHLPFSLRSIFGVFGTHLEVFISRHDNQLFVYIWSCICLKIHRLLFMDYDA